MLRDKKHKNTTSGAMTRMDSHLSDDDSTQCMESILNKLVISPCNPKPFEDGDLSSYLHKLNVVAKVNNWTNTICVVRLLIYLKGRALLIYEQLMHQGESQGWEELCKDFMSLFHPPEEHLVWLKKFYAHTQ